MFRISGITDYLVRHVLDIHHPYNCLTRYTDPADKMPDFKPTVFLIDFPIKLIKIFRALKLNLQLQTIFCRKFGKISCIPTSAGYPTQVILFKKTSGKPNQIRHNPKLIRQKAAKKTVQIPSCVVTDNIREWSRAGVNLTLST